MADTGSRFDRISAVGSHKSQHGALEARLASNQRSERITKFMCTYAKNANTGKLKLLTYDLKMLVKYGAICSAFVKGTIFTMDGTLLWMILAQGVIAIVAGALASLDHGANAISVAGLQQLAEYLGSFIPFVLALYISLTMQRWWSLRTQALGPVFSSLSNVCMTLIAVAPEDAFHDARVQVLRYGLACTNLMVKAARCSEDLEVFVEEKILTREEVDIIARHDLYQRAMIMWSWILRICYCVWQEGKIAPPLMNPVILEAKNARDGIETIHTYQDTQLPFAYVHLITLLVNINNLIVSIKCGVVGGICLKQIISGNGDSSQYWTFFNELTMWFIVPVIYHGLLAISYVIHDPFGEDLLDLPIAAYTEYAMKSCKAVYDSKCPVEEMLFKKPSEAKSNEAAMVVPPAPLRSLQEPPSRPADVEQQLQKAFDDLGTRLERASQEQTRELLAGLTKLITGLAFEGEQRGLGPGPPDTTAPAHPLLSMCSVGRAPPPKRLPVA